MGAIASVALLLCAAAAWGQTGADVEAVVTTDMGSFRFEFAPDKAPRQSLPDHPPR